jgi:hypothetical protein
MLDYAANGVVYWPDERLRSDFESRCAKDAKEPEEEFRASLGDELDPERFGMTSSRIFAPVGSGSCSSPMRSHPNSAA